MQLYNYRKANCRNRYVTVQTNMTQKPLRCGMCSECVSALLYKPLVSCIINFIKSPSQICDFCAHLCLACGWFYRFVEAMRVGIQNNVVSFLPLYRDEERSFYEDIL